MRTNVDLVRRSSTVAAPTYFIPARRPPTSWWRNGSSGPTDFTRASTTAPNAHAHDAQPSADAAPANPHPPAIRCARENRRRYHRGPDLAWTFGRCDPHGRKGESADHTRRMAMRDIDHDHIDAGSDE